MDGAQQFAFSEAFDAFGVPDFVPLLPLKLSYGNSSSDTAIEVKGLLDTGASVNVLPYDVGRQLGAVWEEQTTAVTLAGNLASVEARGLLVKAQVGDFLPVSLVFAWSLSNDVPLLLGRMNFFMEFDVCFYRSQLRFDVCPKRN
ncbi:MAG: aspartyl protease family protein [Cyanobacteria bacterium P01_F01_bin.150]